jgi:phosphatidylinositol alpha-1,6-mannosyltransferase
MTLSPQSPTHSPLSVALLTADLTHRHGWGSYSLSLVEALRAAGVDVTVIAARNTPLLDGLEVHPLLPAVEPRESLFLLKQAGLLTRLRALVRGCDVIHCTVEPFAPLAAALAGNRPLFITGHGSYVRIHQQRRFPVNRLYAWALRRGTLVCVSHYTAKVAAAALPGVKTVVVNNGVDASRFAHLPPLSEPRRGPIVLSVGAIKARKGSLELVRALVEVRKAIPNVQGVLIGSVTMEPAYVERVRDEIARLGMGANVHLPGYVDDATLKAWYGAADVFALPSLNDGWKFEGYGLALIEASAAGLPVIGTRDCGAEDAIDDGVTGLLVSQTNLAAELPAAILALLTDRERAHTMGEAGRVKARAQTWANVAAQMIGLYNNRADSRV